jgi:hypothetical protein
MKNCKNKAWLGRTPEGYVLFFLNFHWGREKNPTPEFYSVAYQVLQPFCKMGLSEPELQGEMKESRNRKHTPRRKGKSEVTPQRPSLTRREHRRCSR